MSITLPFLTSDWFSCRRHRQDSAEVCHGSLRHAGIQNIFNYFKKWRSVDDLNSLVNSEKPKWSHKTASFLYFFFTKAIYFLKVHAKNSLDLEAFRERTQNHTLRR